MNFSVLRLTLFLLAALLVSTKSFAVETPRQVLAKAALAEDEAQRRALIASLAGEGDEAIEPLLTAWKLDALFIYTSPTGAKIPVQLVGARDADDAQEALRLDTGKALTDAAGHPMRLAGSSLKAVRHNSALRKIMKGVVDLLDLSSPDPVRRIQAIKMLGQAQNPDKLPVLQARLKKETNARARVALREACALIQLKDPSDEVRLQALHELEAVHTLSSSDFLRTELRDAEARRKPELVAAARAAQEAVERHRGMVDFVGTLFRSLSLGSILLIVALGLAITFGLMGVINMAHGEMIAIGAYTTYVVQNIFGSGLALSPFGWSISLPGLNATGWTYQSYFLISLPLSFLAAALSGMILERTIIQYLYRRPLESLLATWGVSLILQELLRLIFGANNVQVSSPIYLSGNWTISDVLLGWNRVFVIGFAAVIVLGVWLVLTKTSLGLLIRAVMQNRTMASCMGVRTDRVNMLTFGLGSGLAGLAGAFLSQIGNVGPSLGQSYIVDSFMVVVVGGVGNLVGTVISGLGIGSLDQFIQQYAPALAGALSAVPFVGGFLQNLAQDSAVFGKILVLCGIILFLQWRPAGLFVARSRSLD
jgi:urea transport system permease protein